MKLSKDVFLALCAVAWADGEMKPSEAAILLRAARASGVAGADLDAVDRATKSREATKKLPKISVSTAEGEFVYALACLLSASDGAIDEAEREAIAAIADRLRIPFEVRARAAAASVTVGKTLDAGEDALAALTRELEGHR